jgi:hypothetical protein
MTRAVLMAAAFGALLSPGGLAAQSDTAPEDQVIVEDAQGAGHSGRLAVNIAAGSGNQQASSAILAIGDIALTHGRIVQHTEAGEGDRATRIVLGPGVFSDMSGLVSINITAGALNQSANLAALAIGRSGALSDELLAQTRAPHEPSGGTVTAATGGNDAIVIDDDAFARGSGLFQANLMGGERNSSANTFSLTVTAGGQP